MKPSLTLVHLTLIDALAEQATIDYLREEAAPALDSSQPGPNPVPLPAFDQAA